MSYLLEALRKSDKERQDGRIPDLQTVHSRPQERRRKVSFVAYWLLGFVVFVLFCGTVWILWHMKSTDSGLIGSSPTVNEAIINNDSVVTMEKVPNSGLVKSIQIESESGKVNDVPLENPLAVESGPSQFVKEPVESVLSKTPLFDELPVTVRARIPELSFAGHVYSDQPQKRLIIINNRIVREEDRVDNDLVLEEITREGVVLRYQDSVFRVLLF